MGEQINIGSLVADLDIKTTNLEANMANAGSALYEVKVKIADLQRAFSAGTVGATEFADRMQFLTMSQSQLEDALANATKATVASTSAFATGAKGASSWGSSMNTANSQSRQAAVAMMQLGYAVDDLQYGFRGVVNNVAPFVHSISIAAGAAPTLAAGLAAGAQVGVVAAYQLYTHWNQVMDAFGTGKVRTEAEEMDELGKKTGKTADETERLNKYKKEQAEIAAILSEKSKEQKDSEKDVKSAFAEFGDEKATGGEKVVAGIAAVLGSRGAPLPNEEESQRIEELKRVIKEDGPNAQVMKHDAEDEKDYEKNQGIFGIQIKESKGTINASEQLQNELDRVKARVAGENVVEAKNQALAAVQTDDGKRALLAKAEAKPEAFPKGFASSLRANLPENRKFEQDMEQLEKEFYVTLKINEKEDAADARDHAKIDKAGKRKQDSEEAKQEKEDARLFETQVKQSTRSILSGPKALDALDDNLTTENVEESLKDAGMLPEQARKLAPQVSMRAKQETDEKVQEYALKNGMTEDQARGAMKDDERSRFEDDAQKRAKKLDPNIDKFAENRVVTAMMSGDPQSMDVVRAQIAKKLRDLDMKDGKQDMTDEQIDAATDATVDDAKGNIDKKIMQDKGETPKQEKSKVQQFDAAALASKVQGGVGTPLDEQKKSNTYLDQAVKYLAKMAGNNGASGDMFNIG